MGNGVMVSRTEAAARKGSICHRKPKTTALIGGIFGCIIVFPINGYTTSTMNWQTFSNVAFAFQITPDLLAEGIVFALFMGFIGGLSPSIRAARLPVSVTLREL